ncbi:hypothetical protein BUALT_Bualt14G0062100 [Buddleja alternifolia]|uniref:F-box domain-containing protein n=1 Tax=Buddleja alternifolia TaxID=168488 RepID=A0AAV6WHB1_9LAMI|nr:hypothetical protein BUALT_Bualt14G0062100 [Buddleja alternifolia]
MKNPNLPQEIMIEIFSRLPTKSIGKCRCLSKRHRSLLSTPQFIKTHFTTHKTHHQEEHLILITPSHSITTINNDAVSTKLDLPNTWTNVVGSCNGLVLLANEEGEKLLMNPITLQQLEIPNSPLALNRYESFSMHGFGYDSSTDDYKIVTLSYYNSDNEYEPDCDDIFVDVYSVKTGVWKRVDSSPYDHAVPHLSSGSFVNGAIHWLASSPESGYPSVIAAFDLANELFDEIPAPIGVDAQKFVFNMLMVVDGCLCMIDVRRNGATDIWVMKEYGLRESWSKISVERDYEWDIVKALCFIGDEEVVLVTEQESLVVHNMKDGSLKDMIVDGAPATVIDGGTFVESLVCPVVDAFNNA